LISETKTRGYTVTSLIKSSGLLADMRLLLAAWDENKTVEENFESALRQNLFGKASRKRVADLLYVIKRRYLPQDGSDRAFRTFVSSSLPSEITDRVLYYYTALAEPLIYDFVTDFLFERYLIYNQPITIQSALDFIQEAIRQEKTKGQWESENTRERVAQGLLATLRDFGVLEGVVRSSDKRIAEPRLHILAFGYIAFHIKRCEPSGERLVNHPNWRLFLLGTRQVERLLTEADAEGLLTYQAAGSVIRIEFPTLDFEEYSHALTARAF